MRKLRPFHFISLPLFLCLAAYADVSQTFVVRIQPSKTISPELAVEFTKKFTGNEDAQSFETKIKGGRVLVRVGTFLSMSDFDGALLTVVDRPSKRYSTVSPQEYQLAWRTLMSAKKEEMSKAPGIRIEEKIHPTGQTKKIHGIDTEEHQLRLAMRFSETESIGVRMSMWTPSMQERVRNPMLLELQRYAERAYVPGDFVAELSRTLGTGDGSLTEVMEAMKSIGVALELRIGYTFSGMGSEPLMELVQELIEFSGDQIPEVVFAVPRDYAPVPIGELLPDVMSPVSTKSDVKAPVMRPGTEDPVADPDRPKLQRRTP